MRKKIKKTFIGVVGGLVVLIGIVLIPYPGPGWLVVFTGLGILSTEYDFAKRWLAYGRAKYEAWNVWTANQSTMVKALILLFTTAVVVVTIWLLNGYGILNHFLGLGWDWVSSPLPVFN